MCGASLFLLLLCASDALPIPTTSTVTVDPARLAWLRQAVALGLQQTWQKVLNNTGPSTGTGRDCSNAALAELLLSEPTDGAAAQRALSLLRRPECAPGPQFNGQAYSSILNMHRKRFNSSDWAWIVGAVRAELAARAPAPPAPQTALDVSYSNMFFMNTANLVLFGEALAREADPATRALGTAAAAAGYAQLDQWLAYAAHAGNHEFLSPTYYWVQLNALHQGFAFAARPNSTGRAAFGAILDHLWADIGANYFPGTQTLSGAHTRDYDFLFGHGALMVWTWVMGLGDIAAPPSCEHDDAHCERANNEQNALVLASLLAADAVTNASLGYLPTTAALSASHRYPRVVASKWLEQAQTANAQSARFGDRTNYVTQSFAMGTASQDYITNTHSAYYAGPQDKLLNIELAWPDTPSAPINMSLPLPDITFVPDYLDAPWGHELEPTTGKPSHLALHPGIVQVRGAVLLTAAVNPHDQLDGFNLTAFTSIASNLVLPCRAADEVLTVGNGSLGERGGHGGDRGGAVPFDLSKGAPFAAALADGATLGLRVGRAAVVVRPFELDRSCAWTAAEDSQTRGRSGVSEGGDPGSGGVSGSSRRRSSSTRWLLQGDAAGMALGAMRLTGYHFRVETPGDEPVELPANETQLRAGMLLVAAEVPDDHDAVGANATNGETAGWASLSELAEAVARVEITSAVEGDGAAAVWHVAAAVPSKLLGPGFGPGQPVGTNSSSTTTSGKSSNDKNSSSNNETVVLEVRRYRFCGIPGAGRRSSNGNVWNCLLRRAVDGAEITPQGLSIDGEFVAPLPPPLGPLAQ